MKTILKYIKDIKRQLETLRLFFTLEIAYRETKNIRAVMAELS
jgi:hypothetical protein